MSQRVVGFVIVTLFIQPLPTTRLATAAAGDAQPDLLALCAAWNAATAFRQVIYTKPEKATDLLEILELNMTLSEESWKERFDGTADEESWAGYKKKKGTEVGDTNWELEWPHWWQARKATKSGAKDWTKKAAEKATKTTNQQALAIVANEAAEALALFQSPQIDHDDAKAGLVAKIKKTAAEAMCVSPFAPDTEGQGCKPFSQTPNKATFCADTKNTHAGSCLAHDTICLCSRQTNTECTTGDTGATVLSGDDNLKAGAFAAVTALCPKASNSASPSELATLAIAAFSSRLAASKPLQTAGEVLLGKTYNANCQSSDSACINYGNYFVGTATGIEEIPWVAKLREASRLYSELQEPKAHDSNVNKQLKAIKAKIERMLDRPLLPPLSHSTEATSTQAPAKAQEVKADCNKHHGSNTACPRDKCNYDEKEKKCNPIKQVEGSETPGTGEGAAADQKGEKFSKYGTEKNSCDNDSNCKWE
uniref:Variant surface glycoprotein 1125.4568 n=1 Tax=Trypanosoma brucei TaxID=5691 RepID=A0A1J0RAQ5_9TRYP|nr:variant surface glycoprotein 1125.4568 [Trypanosoma brucei]